MIDLSEHLKPDTFEAIGRPGPLTTMEVLAFAESMKLVPDSWAQFPRGKWATIQAIQAIAENERRAT